MHSLQILLKDLFSSLISNCWHLIPSWALFSFSLIIVSLGDLFSFQGFKFYLYPSNYQICSPQTVLEVWFADPLQPSPLRGLPASQIQKSVQSCFLNVATTHITPDHFRNQHHSLFPVSVWLSLPLLRWKSMSDLSTVHFHHCHLPLSHHLTWTIVLAFLSATDTHVSSNLFFLHQ